MKSKVKDASILITGANGGIAIETIKLLIAEKPKRIVLACRTQEKANSIKSTLQADAGVEIEAYGGFDMNNKEGIKEAVRVLPKNEALDIVFLQAGGMVVANNFQFVIENGEAIEKSVYQNVLGGYITLNSLEENNLIAPGARVVFAGGEGARGITGMIKKPAFHSLDDFLSYIKKGNGKYNDINALGISKFMSALLVQKLASLDSNREYVWFSPGLTSGTNGLVEVSNPKKYMMEKIGFPIMNVLGLAQSPASAARKYAECLIGKYGKNGDLIGAPEGKALGKLVDQKPMNSGLTNHQFIDAFWELTLKTLEN